MIPVPLPYILAGAAVAALVVAVTADALEDRRRERQRAAERRWRQVQRAIDGGVTADAVPMGPIPEYLGSLQTWTWFDRYIEPMGREG